MKQRYFIKHCAPCHMGMFHANAGAVRWQDVRPSSDGSSDGSSRIRARAILLHVNKLHGAQTPERQEQGLVRLGKSLQSVSWHALKLHVCKNRVLTKAAHKHAETERAIRGQQKS